MGLAVYDGAQVIAESLWTSPQHHTVELAPAVAALLSRCGLPAGQISVLGVAIGPGSFTSLRVGLSFVKGLALALRIPLVGVPSLDIIAAAQPPSKLPLVVVIEAGRNRLAIGRYKCRRGIWQADGVVETGTANSLAVAIDEPTLVAGQLTTEERQRLARKRVNVVLVPPAHSVRRPAVLAELAWARWKAGKADELASLAPIYLHLSESLPA
jgi:tRNA threonylcarbamoyladenosine biosynthesis protein TsaB